MAYFCIVKTLSEELLNLRTVFILQSRAVERNIITIFITKKLEKWLSTSFKPILNALIYSIDLMADIIIKILLLLFSFKKLV